MSRKLHPEPKKPRPSSKLTELPSAAVHREAAQYEDDNVGVEAANRRGHHKLRGKALGAPDTQNESRAAGRKAAAKARHQGGLHQGAAGQIHDHRYGQERKEGSGKGKEDGAVHLPP